MNEKKFLDIDGLELVIDKMKVEINQNQSDLILLDDTTYEPLEEEAGS